MFLPGSPELFGPLAPNAELEGTVVDFSDSGDRRRAFAVVEVIRKQMVVVATEKLQLISGDCEINSY